MKMHRLLRLTVWFIMAAFAAIHAADVGEKDILAAARKWIADNAVFKAEAPNAVPETVVQMAGDDGKPMPLWRVDLAPTGYLVMSSDDTLPPVIAFNTNGSFDLPEGHPMPSMLKRQGEIFQNELARPRTRGNELAGENQARWNALLKRTRAVSATPSVIIVEPMLTTAWGQNGYYYNYLCPSGDDYFQRTLTGCVPTAYSQILKFHEWPPAGQGTAQNTSVAIGASMKADYSFPYDWKLMRDDHNDAWKYKENIGNIPEDNISRSDWAVGRLEMEMGVYSKAGYGYSETGAIECFIDLASKVLMYADTIQSKTSAYYSSTTQEALRAEMLAGRPVLVTGHNSSGGHEFIADGLSNMDRLDYYHFNMGWKGYDNGWYLLTDAFSYLVYGVIIGIMPKPVPVFKPMSVEQLSSFTLSWDFPKRLTAEAFRLTKTSGSTSSVISSSIAGTARSYDLTGQAGTATYTLEAKVDGEWQEASEGVTVSVKANPVPMLALMVDDELNSVAGLPFTTTIVANNSLQNLFVSCSRPDMVADASIIITGSGKSRSISFTPASGLVGNAILYLTGVDAVGNVVKKTVLLRVLENTLTWNTSLSSALERAHMSGRLILMVSGEAGDTATSEFMNSICETDVIKKNLLAHYELWYDSSLEGIPTYARDFGEEKPFIAVINPAGKMVRLRGHAGVMTTDETTAFLDTTLPYFLTDDETVAIGTTQSLELSVLDPNAEIRYRLDSVAPTVSSMLYSNAIQLTTTTTISARAFKYGLPVSDTVTKTYTFLPQVATPVLNADEEMFFSENCLVTASCETSGAMLRYTTDGTIPTDASPLFPAAGLTITDDLLLVVRAFKTGMKSSESVVSRFVLVHETTAEEYNYTIHGNHVTIDKYIGDLTNIVIPTTIEGKPVDAIGNGAFEHNILTAISIPFGVTSIGECAFSDCSALTAVSIPSSVTSIGEGAFSNCTGLTSVVIPSNVTSIGGGAFSNCSRLISVTISSGVTSIGEGAFANCIALMSIVIPSSVTSIGDSAFSACIGLTSVEISSGVTSIGDSAFSDCIGLTSVSIPSSVTHLGSSAFFNCIGLTSVSIPSSVTFWGSSAFSHCSELRSVEISPGVTSIGSFAFSDCIGLTSVSIPSSVTYIGENAFYSCSGLTSVEIPSGVTYIGESAFANCLEMTSVSIPSSVTIIGNFAFSYCMLLASVEIPSGVTYIGDDAFSNCIGLTSVSIPSSVTYIGDSAFSNCSALTSVSIPSSVTSIGEGAFSNCSNLTSIHVDVANANYTSIDGVLFSKSKDLLYVYPPAKEGNHYSIPSGVTSIGNYAFSDCIGLTSVSIPSGVTSIGKSAFYDCIGLTSVSIPSSVTYIGGSAFSNCSALTSVSIPSSVTYIGGSAFSNCVGLTSVSISSGVTSIGNYAFSNCSGLTSVSIPSGVTSIGHFAFAYCKNLTSVFIPETVETIEDWAFNGCSLLKEISFDGACPVLGTEALPSPLTCNVWPGMGWEDAVLPDGVAISIREGANPPVISREDGSEAKTFYNSLRIIISGEGEEGVFRYTLDGSMPTDESPHYTQPLEITQTCTVAARCFINGEPCSGTRFVEFVKIHELDDVFAESGLAFETDADNPWLGMDDTMVEGGLVAKSGVISHSQNSSVRTTVTGAGRVSFFWKVSSELNYDRLRFYVDGKEAVTGISGNVDWRLVTVDIANGGEHVLTWTYSKNASRVSGDDCGWIANVVWEPKLISIAISGNAAIVADDNANYTCTATWGDGTTSNVIPEWSVMPSTYASVTAAGVVTNHNTATADQTVMLHASYTAGGVTTTASMSIMLEAGTTAIIQTLSLESGWNWVGFNVLPQNYKVGDVLGKTGFSVNDIIQTNGGMARYTGSSWLPGSFAVEHGRLYQIYVANATAIMVFGTACEQSTVPLVSGWNWIANPTAKAVALSELTHSGGWTAGDRIQFPGNGVTFTGSKWIPAGFTLDPGKGYQLFTAAAGTLAFPEAGLEVGEALYVVVDLSGGPNAESYPVRYTNKAPNLDDDTCRTTELWLRKIPAGTFIMGSPDDEMGRWDNETQHEVTLTHDYYMSVFECTQKQWYLIMGSNPSENKGDCRPVQQISYNTIRGASATAGGGWPAYGHAVDDSSFMGKLRKKTGLVFDLPTEAQWEYACRAGMTTSLNSGMNLTNSNPFEQDVAMDEVGRYQYNQSDGKGGYTSIHTKVGSYLPNAWGLYDMHGNVEEWCLDWANDYGAEAVEDPQGANTGRTRVVRGGYWNSWARDCRSAFRTDIYPSISSYYCGVRIVLLP